MLISLQRTEAIWEVCWVRVIERGATPLPSPAAHLPPPKHTARHALDAGLPRVFHDDGGLVDLGLDRGLHGVDGGDLGLRLLGGLGGPLGARLDGPLGRRRRLLHLHLGRRRGRRRVGRDVRLSRGPGLGPPPRVQLGHQLIVAWQQLGKGGGGPLFQGLRHDSVVGEGQRARRHAPCHLVVHALDIDQQTQQLSDGAGGVGVVHLEDGKVGERGPVARHARGRGLEACNHVLQGRRHEKVLLLQAQQLALLGGIVGVQDGRDFGGLARRRRRLFEAAIVEGGQVQLGHRLGLPQAQVANGGGAEAGDGHVVRLGNDLHTEFGLGVGEQRWVAARGWARPTPAPVPTTATPPTPTLHPTLLASSPGTHLPSTTLP